MNSNVREKIICVFQPLGFVMESQIAMELKMNMLIPVVVICTTNAFIRCLITLSDS